jgi:hypothetical protein
MYHQWLPAELANYAHFASFPSKSQIWSTRAQVRACRISEGAPLRLKSATVKKNKEFINLRITKNANQIESNEVVNIKYTL